MKKRIHSRPGFTLVELLAVVSIIAILAALVTTSVSAVQRSSQQTREVANARQLMVAYLRYAGENDGQLLPGYGEFTAQDETGEEVHSPASNRYPFRLAPYLNYDMRILWGNGGDSQLQAAASGNRENYHYLLSVQPALGLNQTFLGGDYNELPPDRPKLVAAYGSFCVTRLGQATHPASLIVFASAASGYQGAKLNGYFKIQPPQTNGRKWPTKYDKDEAPEAHGFVDFRFSDKAVAAMLDGHVEMLSFEQMDDMRRWSNLAAELNDPNWTLGKQ